jgi:hypothetical protein
VKVDVFISGKLHTISVQRHQIPLQLAFSRTAHGAQGKTMSAIRSDLNFGGAQDYVQPVTLEMLNAPPPKDLRVEHNRQKALERNTLVRLGYTEEKSVKVPDPEMGLKLTDGAGKVKLTWNIEGKCTKTSPSTKALKREATGPATDDDAAIGEY